MNKIFLTQLQENNGEVFIKLPPEFLELSGWTVDDVVGFKNLADGGIHILNLTRRKNSAMSETFEDDWSCTSQGELIGTGYLDQSIRGYEEEYEEEINLYTTYGGD